MHYVDLTPFNLQAKISLVQTDWTAHLIAVQSIGDKVLTHVTNLKIAVPQTKKGKQRRDQTT